MGLILANFNARQPISFFTGLFVRTKAGAAATPPRSPDPRIFGSFPPFLRRNRGRGTLGHGTRNAAQGARNTARQGIGPGARPRWIAQGIAQVDRPRWIGALELTRFFDLSSRAIQARARREVSRAMAPGPVAGLTTKGGRCWQANYVRRVPATDATMPALPMAGPVVGQQLAQSRDRVGPPRVGGTTGQDLVCIGPEIKARIKRRDDALRHRTAC